MNYVIYCAVMAEGTLINMTHDPEVDFTFLSQKYELHRIEVLTAEIGISLADYVMRNMDRGHSAFERLMLRGGKKSGEEKLHFIKRLMAELDIKPLRKSNLIQEGSPLPGEGDLEAVRSLLMGRIMSLREIQEAVKLSGIILDLNINDILQNLYLKRQVVISPSLHIEKPGKKYRCLKCSREISYYEYTKDSKCPSCGEYLEEDEPLFASDYGISHDMMMHVKFKEYKKFTYPQDRASLELAAFLDDSREECLFYPVPGMEDINIVSRAIREVLNRGGRAAVAVLCREEIKKCFEALRDTFPNSACLLQMGTVTLGKGDIVVCGIEDIYGYYKAFDLVLLWEASVCPKRGKPYPVYQIRRALRDGGKIIYSSPAPDFGLYTRAEKGDIGLVTLPIRGHNRPHPEPRIISYKGLSQESFFIPAEVMDFIVWSVEEGVKIHIIVPLESLINRVREMITDCDEIRKDWLIEPNPKILITTFPCRRIYVEEEENIIVLFADDTVIFDEKALLDVAGMAGRINIHMPEEVIFVGSKETDEMHNAKSMIRSLNKNAWEMGYLK